MGNIVQGVRLAWAQGRDLGTAMDDDSDAAKKVCALADYSLLSQEENLACKN